MSLGRILLLAMLIAFPAVLSGCQSTYYTVWETLGKEKRHLLRDNIEKAQTEQEEAQEGFKDVLTRMKELYGFEGGDLEAFYTRLKDDYDACEGRASAVEERIDRVEQIAADLFVEWEAEIQQIGNAGLKAKSRQSLANAKKRYARLKTAMTRARTGMDPVLGQLKDYVLFLKHNLNAQAIGTLKKEVGGIEVEVEDLLRHIQASIQEADEFLKTLQ